MDINKIIARAKSVLLSPKTEWPVIAAEPETTSGLFMGYVVPMAALPAIAGFIKSTLIGTTIPFVGGVYRSSIAGGITGAVLSFVVTLFSVFVVGLIIDALAPTFGATKDRVQALKTSGYAYTASFVAGLLVIIPGIGLAALIGFIALFYGLYLLYLGLPHTMKAPPEKAVGYTVVTVIAAIVLNMILGVISASIVGTAALGAGRSGLFGASAPGSTSDGGSVTGGVLGGLAQMANQAEKAGKQMEAAEKSGDADAQAKAAGNLIGAVLGGGTQVESLPTERIKGFLPATLGGLKMQSSSAERNGAMGMQVSEAKASYGDGSNRSVDLEITDMGSARGLMGLAAWANIEEDKQTQTGYEKTYKQGENMVHEEWDNADKRGEYSAMVADRFMVKVSGNAGSIDELKSALGGVDLAGLAALRNDGLKAAN